MISKARPAFWRVRTARSFRESTRPRSLQAIRAESDHPSLRFKKLQARDDVWSVRVNEQYRSVGVRSGETIEWIWIGTHNEFENPFS